LIDFFRFIFADSALTVQAWLVAVRGARQQSAAAAANRSAVLEAAFSASGGPSVTSTHSLGVVDAERRPEPLPKIAVSFLFSSLFCILLSVYLFSFLSVEKEHGAFCFWQKMRAFLCLG
jgi:hypothetical protein